ncbi:MAG: diphthine--ammonia ligase [Desulfurococcaceae archaeon]
MGNLKNAAVLFTGGKDSTYALHRAVESGLRVSVLLTVVPHYKYSMLYHQPHFSVLVSQAQSLGIPLESIGLYDKLKELDALEWLVKKAVHDYGIDVLVTGAIRSDYQRKAFNKVASKYGVTLYSPHWGEDDYSYMRSLLEYGIEFAVVSITSMGIPHDILGQKFTLEDLEKLTVLSRKYGFNLSFEGGDAETLVLNAPLFKYEIRVYGKAVWVSDFEGYFVIEDHELVKKH